MPDTCLSQGEMRSVILLPCSSNVIERLFAKPLVVTLLNERTSCSSTPRFMGFAAADQKPPLV